MEAVQPASDGAVPLSRDAAWCERASFFAQATSRSLWLTGLAFRGRGGRDFAPGPNYYDERKRDTVARHAVNGWNAWAIMSSSNRQLNPAAAGGDGVFRGDTGGMRSFQDVRPQLEPGYILGRCGPGPPRSFDEDSCW